MHAPPTDTLWSTFESADEQHTNTYGCAHGWEFRWLKNFKALEYLAGRGEAINTEDRTNWTRSLYPFIRLADNELFGPQWEEYLLESMGHDTPELRGRWPEWLLKVHT